MPSGCSTKICTCEAGSDGSPCSHQLAIALHFRSASLHIIPTLHPSSRRQLAYIALGKEANTDTTLYAAVSQHHDEIEEAGASTERVEDSVASCWSTIGESTTKRKMKLMKVSLKLIITWIPLMPSQELELVLEDLKMRLQDQDLQLQSGEKIY